MMVILTLLLGVKKILVDVLAVHTFISAVRQWIMKQMLYLKVKLIMLLVNQFPRQEILTKMAMLMLLLALQIIRWGVRVRLIYITAEHQWINLKMVHLRVRIWRALSVFRCLLQEM